MKGIILAAGRCTRLYPMTRPVCKPLLSVYDKPLIYYPLSVLIQAGIRDVLVIVPPGEEGVFYTLLRDGMQLGMSIHYTVQPVARGIADAMDIAAYLEPSARGELEIPHVNQEYLRRDKLRVIPLEDDYVWLDAGSTDSLLTAAQIIRDIQKDGQYVGCIEELAYKEGWITSEQLRKLGNELRMTAYGQYLLSL